MKKFSGLSIIIIWLKLVQLFDAFEPSNLFVIDKDLNTYEITLFKDNALTYSYNFDDGRKYIAHIDVNSIEMDNLINKLHYKKRNIFSWEL